MNRLAEQVAEVLSAFQALSTPPALIGGLALAAHKVIRATRDVDFLVAENDAEQLHRDLVKLGYRCVHRSADAANYIRGDHGIDLLIARRPIAMALLDQATERVTPMGVVRVVGAEGLIGFKLQALTNDPTRANDLGDIRAVLRNNRGSLDMSEVRRYFRLFEKEELLDELIAEID